VSHGFKKMRSLDDLLTDHGPHDLVPYGVRSSPLSLPLYLLAVFPGEVQIDLSPRVLEDFLPKFGENIAQKLLLFLRR
jgi:hypothetical protein